MTSEPAKNSKEILEKRILLLSFISGLFFVAAELVYAVYSHSQSTLMDALYDASELIFIVLILFLTHYSINRFLKKTLWFLSGRILFYPCQKYNADFCNSQCSC